MDGRVYLTADEYDSAEEALRKLALPRRPSGYFEISEDSLRELTEPSAVQARHGQPGGGTEQYVQHAIEVRELVWVAIDP